MTPRTKKSHSKSLRSHSKSLEKTKAHANPSNSRLKINAIKE